MTKRLALIAATGALTLALVGIHSTAFAQGGAFYAPLDAMDELNSAPVGGGGAFGGAVDRARNVAQPGGPMMDPFGAESPGGFGPGALGPGAFGPDGFGPGGFGGQQVIPYVPPATVRAWGGERVVQFNPDPDVDINDYLPSDILADAREIRVLATAQGNYPVPVRVGNEDVYTNIMVRRDYISPEAGIVRTRLISTLRFMSELNPREFSFVRVATTEPLSPLPKMIDLEAEQDNRLSTWMNDFMGPYLKPTDDPDDLVLVPAFVAPPPLAPNIPLPPNFNPQASEQQGEGQQQGGPGGIAGGGAAGRDMFDGDVTGEPIGNASSRYF